MLKLNKRCKVCQAVKKDKKLLKKIFESNYYDKSSSLSLAEIHRDNEDKFSIRSLYNHVQHHQGLTADDLNERKLESIAKKETDKQIAKAVKHSDVRKIIMNKGYEQIESGEIRLKASDVLRAAEGEVTVEEKQKDRTLVLMEMMWAFASGEQTRELGGFDEPGTIDTTQATERLNSTD